MDWNSDMRKAPRDGTEVLVRGPFTTKVAWWNGVEWQWEYDNAVTYGGTVYSPTHWMPLPTPPETKGE